MQQIEILGVKVNTGVSKAEALNKISSYIENGEHKIICTTNPEFIMQAQKDTEFKEVINNAAISLPDGNGVVMAEAYLNSMKESDSNILLPIEGLMRGFLSIFKTKNKVITGVDLMYDICALASEKGYSVFFLGGWPQDALGRMKKNVTYDLAEKTAGELKKHFPELKVVGATSQFSHSMSDEERTLNFIKDKMFKAGTDDIDIIFVAYGQGSQEKWLDRNLEKIPAHVGIGVGGSFAYIGNDVKRAPNVVKSMKLEWLYRLLTQPWRIKRILTAFPLFPLAVYVDSVRKNKHF